MSVEVEFSRGNKYVQEFFRKIYFTRVPRLRIFQWYFRDLPFLGCSEAGVLISEGIKEIVIFQGVSRRT